MSRILEEEVRKGGEEWTDAVTVRPNCTTATNISRFQLVSFFFFFFSQSEFRCYSFSDLNDYMWYQIESRIDSILWKSLLSLQLAWYSIVKCASGHTHRHPIHTFATSNCIGNRAIGVPWPRKRLAPLVRRLRLHSAGHYN